MATMKFQAHKGVSTENPENTMPSFVAAIEQGYDIIELDVGVTKDLKFVLLHDKEINRTARNKDGSALVDKVAISDITYEQALEYDYGLWFSEEFRGTDIALFEDVLRLAKEKGIGLKIDNKYQDYTEEEKLLFFELLKPYQTVASLTCNQIEELNRAIEVLPEMSFHYDGAVTREKLATLSQILPKERLTVWLPYQNRFTSWFKGDFVTNELADLVKEYAALGIWLISEREELDAAERLGAVIVETNGHLKPQ